MIDSFELLAPKIRAAGMAAKLGVPKGGFGVVTLHRPSNVDDAAKGLEIPSVGEAAQVHDVGHHLADQMADRRGADEDRSAGD